MIAQEAMTINPFWDEAREIIEAKDHMHINKYVEKYGNFWELRDRYCRRYAWAVPDPASLSFVAQWLGPRAIEIGAGTGYWAWQLSQLGVDILAYDDTPPDKEPNAYFYSHGQLRSKRIDQLAHTWYPVKKRGPDVLQRHKDRTLFLCWPPYKKPMASQCLKAYQGNRLVYIGEDKGGCTGDKAFFNLLAEQWRETTSHAISSWFGINDYVTVYDREVRT
jgi:hypothetical protein